MIPNFLSSFLWSYDLARMDKKCDKQVIITNVLNFGNQKAVDWILQNYDEQEIIQVLTSRSSGNFNKRSLNYWYNYFNLPKDLMKQTRF